MMFRSFVAVIVVAVVVVVVSGGGAELSQVLFLWRLLEMGDQPCACVWGRGGIPCLQG